MKSIVKGAPRLYEQLNDHIPSHDSFLVSENLIYAK